MGVAAICNAYYLNNKDSGQYMQYNAGSVSGTSGLLANLGNSIQWEVQNNDGSGCVIRAKNDTSKYLGVPQDTGSDGIEIVTVSGTAVPSRCIWTVNLAYGGGCLVRSSYNSKYLFSSGGFLYTSSITGTVDTSTYNARVWRIIDISSYGNTSSHTSRELEDFVITPMVLKVGKPETPDIFPIPTTANWAGAYNFVYTGYDTTKISYDSVTGTFTAASSLTAPYTATVTAIHKVTGRTTTFIVTVSRQAALIGVTNLGHNHDEALAMAIPHITNCGYTYEYETGAFSTSAIDGYLTNDANTIFASRSHGDYEMDESDTDEVAYTYIVLNDDKDNPVQYRSDGSIQSLDLRNLDIALFIGCRTGHGGENAQNLPAVAVAQGAEVAIGFEEKIPCYEANLWTEEFFKYMSQGYTVAGAVAKASEDYVGVSDHPSKGLAQYVICGNENLKLVG